MFVTFQCLKKFWKIFEKFSGKLWKVFSFSHHRFDIFFTIFAFMGIFLGRMVNIYPITGLVNLSRPEQAKIPERFLNKIFKIFFEILKFFFSNS